MNSKYEMQSSDQVATAECVSLTEVGVLHGFGGGQPLLVVVS